MCCLKLGILLPPGSVMPPRRSCSSPPPTVNCSSQHTLSGMITFIFMASATLWTPKILYPLHISLLCSGCMSSCLLDVHVWISHRYFKFNMYETVHIVCLPSKTHSSHNSFFNSFIEYVSYNKLHIFKEYSWNVWTCICPWCVHHCYHNQDSEHVITPRRLVSLCNPCFPSLPVPSLFSTPAATTNLLSAV